MSKASLFATWCALLGVAAGLGAPAARADADGYRLPVWPQRTYRPEFALVDADGRARTTEDFRGRVALVYFGYARCPDVCPAELLKLSLAIRLLGPLGRRVQVLFVTLDPERDTPGVLKEYVAAFDPGFMALTGTSGQIDRAASSFLVQYARVPQGTDYSISHSSRVLVLDKTAHLRLIGTTETSAADFAHDLAMLAKE